MKKEQKVCAECHKKRERCRAVCVDQYGDMLWICPQCWREWDYDAYLYEHREQQ